MKKFKITRLLAILLVAVIALSGCGKKITNDEPKHDPVKLTLITLSAFEAQANVVRDQLKDIGIDLEVKLYPEFGSYFSDVKSGKYDMTIITMSGSGSPDEQVSPYKTGGANLGGVADAELDAMIDLAATQIPEDYVETYKKIAKYYVLNKAYVVPLFNQQTVLAFSNVVDMDSIVVGASCPRWLRTTSFKDKSLNDTKVYNYAISAGSPDTFDSVRGNSGTTRPINMNANIRMLLVDSNDKITTEGTLAKSYAVSGENNVFYFLLRDDINFGKVENMKAVDTGVMVSAEDVIYTYERAMGKISSPGVSPSLDKLDSISIVTDMEELKNNLVSGTKTSILDHFNSEVKEKCTALVEDRASVNNSEGKYQVIKMVTKNPYPQFLINLSKTQLGIVSKDVVSKVNEGITAENYDHDKDVIYGDTVRMREGKDYNNNMWFSGPYVVTHIDDYATYLESNPGFASGTDEAAKIKNIAMKVVTDNAAQTSGVRNGEIDEAMPTGNNVNICESDKNVQVYKAPHLAVGNINFLFQGDSEVKNEDLRHAILYAINQDEMISIIGNINKAHSDLTMIDVGWYPEQDLKKAKEYMNAYFESKEK